MLTPVELKGSYFEIGKGWGEIFSQEIEQVIATELSIVAAFFNGSTDAVVAAAQRYMQAATAYDPEGVEILRGFSAGAKVDFETIFALRSLFDLLCSGGASQGMCTALAVSGAATKGAQTILAQNVDWHPDLPVALFRITWPNGVKQLSLSMSGIWEYTLASHEAEAPFGILSTLTVTPQEYADTPRIPISFIMNRASRQKRLEHALSTFTNAKSTMPSYVLANGKGEMISIELGLHSNEILYPERDMLVHTNHYLAARYAPKDVFLPFVPDSPRRYARMKKLLDAHYGAITTEHVAKFLSDHNNHPKGICAHVDPESQLPPSSTVASVIMLPKEGAMFIATGNPCANKYNRYELTPQ